MSNNLDLSDESLDTPLVSNRSAPPADYSAVFGEDGKKSPGAFRDVNVLGDVSPICTCSSLCNRLKQLYNWSYKHCNVLSSGRNSAWLSLLLGVLVGPGWFPFFISRKSKN